nr:uncharacterized protein LOC110001598 isoform X1 [Labrus bergylta]
MKVCYTLIIFILTKTQDGNTCMVGSTEIYVHTATEGGNFTAQCFFDDPGERKTFCRNDCGFEDILVATSGVRAQRGRYSMEYYEEQLGASMITLYVSITKLLKSDSGRYSCVFGIGRYPHHIQKFDLRVEDAPTTAQPKWTSPAFSPTPPASTLKTTLTLTTPAAAQGLNQEANTRVQLYVRLVLVIMIIISSAVGLIVCRRSARRPGEPDEELDYVNITNANLVHEGVREKILEI